MVYPHEEFLNGQAVKMAIRENHLEALVMPTAKGKCEAKKVTIENC